MAADNISMSTTSGDNSYNGWLKELKQRYLSQRSAIQNSPQAADDFKETILFAIPWDHHRRIIDRCKNDAEKAIFFVEKTLTNNWSRDVCSIGLTQIYQTYFQKSSNHHCRLLRKLKKN